MNPRNYCPRCRSWYLAEDGYCECEDYTDEQLAAGEAAAEEAAIARYEDSLEPDDHAADLAADAYERDIERGWP